MKQEELVTYPSMETLKRIAEQLGIEVEDIFATDEVVSRHQANVSNSIRCPYCGAELELSKSPNNMSGEEWVQIEFDKEYRIVAFNIHWGELNANSTGSVVVSTDGTTWKTVATKLGSKSETYEYKVLDTPVNAKYVRLTVTDTSSYQDGKPKYSPDIMSFNIYAN